MDVRRRVPSGQQVETFAAALLVGAGLGTLAAGDPVGLPVVGTAPAAVVGSLGLAAGVGVLAVVKRRSSSCGCGDDCGC